MEAVEMTLEERRQFEAFKAANAKRAEEKKKKEDREAYAALVDETIESVVPDLLTLSGCIRETKASVMDLFKRALEMKYSIMDIKEGQRTHTFTNTDSTKRVTIGHYATDAYRDTVEEGIGMVKEAIESLATDDGSRALVRAVFRLLSRDQTGNLKASRVLQLRKLAEESGNERFQEGVRIIEEAYQPTVSKMFVRAEIRGENNEWLTVPLGMTEA